MTVHMPTSTRAGAVVRPFRTRINSAADSSSGRASWSTSIATGTADGGSPGGAGMPGGGRGGSPMVRRSTMKVPRATTAE